MDIAFVEMQDGGCNFLGWYEGHVDPFVGTLLVDLHDGVWTMKKQRALMKQTMKQAFEKIEEEDAEIADLKKELTKLEICEGENEVLEGKVKRLEVETKLLRAFIVLLFAVAVFIRLD
ncbi:hypothetical protein PR202_gb12835 [Eleusine coracana subsp. coracana]|uniref:Uncharacterized protein n=1 Tax=Eleusine coracana subsp. coracana TaxID=191504 RepID=A0AAV5ESK4_ELECO|nr:hypothetical protein PR202_gb12835 [Eleusine coracana subsp. coracana]